MIGHVIRTFSLFSVSLTFPSLFFYDKRLFYQYMYLLGVYICFVMNDYSPKSFQGSTFNRMFLVNVKIYNHCLLTFIQYFVRLMLSQLCTVKFSIYIVSYTLQTKTFGCLQCLCLKISGLIYLFIRYKYSNFSVTTTVKEGLTRYLTLIRYSLGFYKKHSLTVRLIF